jgi:hypothetical protein
MTGNTPICSSFSGALPDTLLWFAGIRVRAISGLYASAIVRTGIAATFVADRSLPDVVQAMADQYRNASQAGVKRCSPEKARPGRRWSHIRKVRTPISMVVVQAGTDSADDYIVSMRTLTLAVTHDVSAGFPVSR